jgi:hypothetical protein
MLADLETGRGGANSSLQTQQQQQQQFSSYSYSASSSQQFSSSSTTNNQTVFSSQQQQQQQQHIKGSKHTANAIHCISTEDLLSHRKNKGSWDKDKAYLTLEKYVDNSRKVGYYIPGVE